MSRTRSRTRTQRAAAKSRATAADRPFEERFPFAAAHRLFHSERAQAQWLHKARLAIAEPYGVLRGDRGAL